MSEEQTKVEEQRYPMKQSAAFAGTTFATMGLIDLFAHLGPTGLVVAGLASYVAWRHGPELCEQVRGILPPAPSQSERREGAQEEEEPAQQQGRTFLDWALGRPAADDEVNGVGENASSQPRAGQKAAGLITLADKVAVPVDELAGKAIFIAGIRRSGKTTLGARIAEELGKRYIPMLIPDLEGDYLSLAEVLPRAVIAQAAGTDASHYQGTRPVHSSRLDLKNAQSFGYDLLRVGYQILLDLSSYPSLEEALAVQVKIIRGMFAWANEHPDERVTSAVYLDEAQRYLPQSLADSVIGDKLVIMELLRAYMDVAPLAASVGLRQ
jgi:hypothetical protein